MELTLHRYGDGMVIIRVEDGETQDFVVYKSIICQSSDFVNNELKGPWRESEDGVIKLPTTSVEAFNIYHRWLLRGKLHSKPSAEVVDNTHEEFKNHALVKRAILIGAILLCQEFYDLAKTSFLGHYLLDTAFVDTTNAAIAQCTEDLASKMPVFPTRFGVEFYDVVPEGSSTRSLVADLAAWTSPAEPIESLKRGPSAQQSKEAHADFTMDVFQALTHRFMATSAPISPLEVWKTSCKYHSHGDDKPCYREKNKEYVVIPGGMA